MTRVPLDPKVSERELDFLGVCLEVYRELLHGPPDFPYNECPQLVFEILVSRGIVPADFLTATPNRRVICRVCNGCGREGFGIPKFDPFPPYRDDRSSTYPICWGCCGTGTAALPIDLQGCFPWFRLGVDQILQAEELAEEAFHALNRMGVLSPILLGMPKRSFLWRMIAPNRSEDLLAHPVCMSPKGRWSPREEALNVAGLWTWRTGKYEAITPVARLWAMQIPLLRVDMSGLVLGYDASPNLSLVRDQRSAPTRR